jgi:hypothetical protein
MSNHVTLTDDERKEVVGFWGNYFRSSGEGRQPTIFQLDAINDPRVRDAFLFWQISGDPKEFNPGFAEKTEMLALIELFGDNPTGDQAHKALTKIIGKYNTEGAELEDIDSTSVWVIAHVMWLLLGGAWHPALDEITKMVEVVGSYNQLNPENVSPHDDPLTGIGMAAVMLALHVASAGDQHGLELAARMYGLGEDHENTRWAREQYARIRAERIKNEQAA